MRSESFTWRRTCCYRYTCQRCVWCGVWSHAPEAWDIPAERDGLWVSKNGKHFEYAAVCLQAWTQSIIRCAAGGRYQQNRCGGDSLQSQNCTDSLRPQRGGRAGYLKDLGLTIPGALEGTRTQKVVLIDYTGSIDTQHPDPCVLPFGHGPAEGLNVTVPVSARHSSINTELSKAYTI
jgi:hypothetical protein